MTKPTPQTTLINPNLQIKISTTPSQITTIFTITILQMVIITNLTITTLNKLPSLRIITTNLFTWFTTAPILANPWYGNLLRLIIISRFPLTWVSGVVDDDDVAGFCLGFGGPVEPRLLW